MAVHKDQNNRHPDQNEWVFVNMHENMTKVTKQHTKSRSPQFKSSNVSSSQVASAACNEEIKKMTAQLAEARIMNIEYDEFYDVMHKAASNQSLDSNQTNSTIHGPIGASVYDAYSTSAYPLTSNALEQHQRWLCETSYTGIPDWITGAVPSQIFVESRKRQRTRAYSHVAEKKHPSTISSGGMQDWQYVAAPAQATDDVMATGAIFDEESISPIVYASPYLNIE